MCSIGSLELGHNLYPISDIKRELVLNLEGTDRINIVAKEINTIRILATITVYIEDRATKRKLPGLVNIINLIKA